MKALSHSFLELISSVATATEGLHIVDVRQLTDSILLFVFSETKSTMLALFLDHAKPLLVSLDAPQDWGLVDRVSSEALRHHVLKLKIDRVHQGGDDDIIVMDCHKKGDDFQLRNYQLVFELFRKHPNFIVLLQGKIVYVAKSYGLERPRPLLPSMEYSYPPKPLGLATRDWASNIASFLTTISTTIIDERAKPMLQIARKRIRMLEKKIEALGADLSKWRQAKSSREIADYLLTLEPKDEHLASINYLGVAIPLDPRFSIIDNAQLLYRHYKKGKLAVAPIEKQIDLAKSELERLNRLVSTKPISFFDLENMENELTALHLLAKQGTKKLIDPNQQTPYCVTIEGTDLLFGRNASQNDYLTFKVANQSDWFFHIHERPGAHVIVRAPLLTPTLKIHGAMLALALSRQTTGEVDIAKVGTLKKGKVPGQVIMKQRESIRLTGVVENIYELIANARRYQR